MSTPLSDKTISITFDELKALKPCNLAERAQLFNGGRLSVADALVRGVSIRDILWVAGRLGRKDLCVRFALRCAQRVAHLNTDPRVQAALDATQAWLDNPSDKTRRSAYAAADAAATAAYAATAADADAAAYAAAYAAYAAAATAATADAAADAADAAAYAADAAAARKEERDEQRKILIEVFTIPNGFDSELKGPKNDD